MRARKPNLYYSSFTCISCCIQYFPRVWARMEQHTNRNFGERKVISKFLIEIEWQSSRRARLLNESFLPVTESFVEVINEFRDSNYYDEKRWKLEPFWRALSENHVPQESFHTFA